MVIPVANEETALELEVMSCRMEPCGTMVVEVEAGARTEAAEEVGRDTGRGTTGETGKRRRSRDEPRVKLLHILWCSCQWSSNTGTPPDI